MDIGEVQASFLRHEAGVIDRHAPDLGQDNEYVFGALLGIDREETALLERQGVLA